MLVGTDIYKLSDADLRGHITELQSERAHLKIHVVPSISECDTLIGLAHSELSSRASDRMAKRALLLSVIAIVVTCLLTVVQIVIN